MLCRYDTMALKSLDIFSVQGFPVGLVQCESNLLGIINGNGANVGSGGWTNIIEKYAKAKRYCDEPFEVRNARARKVRSPSKANGSANESTAPHAQRRHTLRQLDHRRSSARQPRRRVHRPALFRQRPVRRADGFLLCLAPPLVGRSAEGFVRNPPAMWRTDWQRRPRAGASSISPKGWRPSTPIWPGPSSPARRSPSPITTTSLRPIRRSPSRSSTQA